MLADSIPIYPLYPLLFADSGLSDAQISTLFLLWSALGLVAEVPSGALADRFSRRTALVASGGLQAAGYVLWITSPGYLSFAAGFGLWGLGGAFGSGALEALLYDGLAAVGADEHFARLYGRVKGVGLLAQLPAAVAATVLFSTGGYELVGWASVACCLAASALAIGLPEARRYETAAGAAGDRRWPVGAGQGASRADAPGARPGYLVVLRSGLGEAVRHPVVRAAVVAVAMVGGLDGVEEYFPLLAHDWGVPTSAVPLAVLGIPVVGAAGAALGGSASQLGSRTLALLLAAAVGVFGVAALLGRPIGVAAVAVAYGLYQLVVVVTGARLQERIDGPARATVASVASLGTGLTAMALYAAWALDRPALVALVTLAAATSLGWLLSPARLSPTSAPPLSRDP